MMQTKDNGPMRDISKRSKKAGRPLRRILTKTVLCRRWPSLEKEDKLGFPINNREKRHVIKGIWCGSWASRSPGSGREWGGSFRGRILWLKCNVGLRILVRTGPRETEIRLLSVLDGRTKNLDLIQQVMRSQENLQTCRAIMANVLA